VGACVTGKQIFDAHMTVTEIIILRDMMSCSPVDTHQRIGEPCRFYIQVEDLPWRWRQEFPSKHWHLRTKLCGVDIQETVKVKKLSPCS
jgi:hypothetical protein